MSSSVNQFVEDVEAIAALVAEGHPHEELYELVVDALDGVRPLEHLEWGNPTTATAPSGARSTHAFEAADILPVGRMRHEPWRRVSVEQGAADAVRILFDHAGQRFVPRFWADQEFDSPAEGRYYAHLLARTCCHLHRAGVIERGSIGRRGARYWYRLPTQRSCAASSRVRSSESLSACTTRASATRGTDQRSPTLMRVGVK